MDIDDLIFILLAIGDELISFDSDTRGADDFAGKLLVYGAEAIAAVKNKEELPPLPDIIAGGTGDKLSNAGKISLRIAKGVVLFAQLKFGGKIGEILRYINQAIRALLNGSTVPAAPAF